MQQGEWGLFLLHLQLDGKSGKQLQDAAKAKLWNGLVQGVYQAVQDGTLATYLAPENVETLIQPIAKSMQAKQKFTKQLTDAAEVHCSIK